MGTNNGTGSSYTFEANEDIKVNKIENALGDQQTYGKRRNILRNLLSKITTQLHNEESVLQTIQNSNPNNPRVSLKGLLSHIPLVPNTRYQGVQSRKELYKLLKNVRTIQGTLRNKRPMLKNMLSSMTAGVSAINIDNIKLQLDTTSNTKSLKYTLTQIKGHHNLRTQLKKLLETVSTINKQTEYKNRRILRNLLNRVKSVYTSPILKLQLPQQNGHQSLLQFMRKSGVKKEDIQRALSTRKPLISLLSLISIPPSEQQTIQSLQNSLKTKTQINAIPRTSTYTKLYDLISKVQNELKSSRRPLVEILRDIVHLTNQVSFETPQRHNGGSIGSSPSEVQSSTSFVRSSREKYNNIYSDDGVHSSTSSFGTQREKLKLLLQEIKNRKENVRNNIRNNLHSLTSDSSIDSIFKHAKRILDEYAEI